MEMSDAYIDITKVTNGYIVGPLRNQRTEQYAANTINVFEKFDDMVEFLRSELETGNKHKAAKK
jgi:hypothetical protein